VIAGPLLVLGLLLIVSAVAGARITGRRRGAVASFILSPVDPVAWRATWALLSGMWVEIVGVAIVGTLFSIGGSLILAVVGIPIIGLGIEVARAVARGERGRIGAVDGRPLHAHAYRPVGTSLRDRAEATFLDINRWRDVVYLFVALPLTVLEATFAFTLWTASILLISLPLWASANVASIGFDLASLRASLGDPLLGAAVAIGFILAPVAASASRGLVRLHRAVVEGLLCVSEQRALEQRVETLEVSRLAVLDVEASELRRIERDLHDGAQQRLVMLAMDLGLAAEQIDTDPAKARALVLEASGEAREALAELRDLVRGIAPSILLDRGLVPAVGALAGRSPVPTSISSDLPAGTRLPDAVERAAYYTIAEALANVAKHATATRCEVRVRRGGASAGATGSAGSPGSSGSAGGAATDAGASSTLTIEIHDDGAGGARIVPGGGLAGLVGRIEALDGNLSLESPAGGPTTVRAEIPIRAEFAGMAGGDQGGEAVAELTAEGTAAADQAPR